MIALAALSPTAALAGDSVRRHSCLRAEQPQQPQRQPGAAAQQQRNRTQGCPVNRNLPPVVDPTPMFLL